MSVISEIYNPGHDILELLDILLLDLSFTTSKTERE